MKRMDFWQARLHYEKVDRETRDRRATEIWKRRAEIDLQRSKLWSEGESLRHELMAINFVNDDAELKTEKI